LGIGSICGALTVAGLGKYQRQGRAALLMLVVLGALITGFALSRSFILSCILLFFSGATLLAVFTTVSSLVQMITSDQMRGRVMSVYNVAFRGGTPFGSLVVGALVKEFTAPRVVACNGVLLAMLGLYFLLVNRKVVAL
jgi:predicted MFS family arabinose efflux permease